jgi:hypothetical protein
MARKKTTKSAATAPRYEAFEHPEAQSPMRPDVGTQAEFKEKKPRLPGVLPSQVGLG